MVGLIGLIVYVFQDPSQSTKTIIKICAAIYAVCAFIIFVDFLGLGFLKKYKWTSKIYFPIYRIFGFITLAFLYRPLVYNFLDQKKARWVSTYLVPFYMLLVTLLSLFGKRNSNFQIYGQESSEFFINKLNYEDEMKDKTDLVEFVSIPSKVIEKNYLKVFVSFTNEIEDAVFKIDSTLRPEEDRRGYTFTPDRFNNAPGMEISLDYKELIETQNKYISIVDRIYQLKVDTTFFNKEFTLTNGKNEIFGFETYLNLESLSKGKHLLRLIGPKDTISNDTLMTIPFWYYPQNSSRTNVQNTSIQLDSISSN